MADISQASPASSSEQKRQLLAKLLKKKAAAETVTGRLAMGQQALWFLYQLDRHSAAYNIMCAVRVRADLDIEALQKALQGLVNRHPMLRTTYGVWDGLPVQRTRSFQELPLARVDATGWSPEELDRRLRETADEPFDLQQGPVFRAHLFSASDGPHVVLLTAHHIALDFWSYDLLLDELDERYRHEVTGTSLEMAAPQAQYADFVRWQEETLAGAEGDRLWEYWRDQLSGELPNLQLPADRPRPSLQSYRGRSFHFTLPDELSGRLAELAKAEGATLFATLLAAYQVLMYRLSGQEDILVGSPTAGRSRAEFEGVIGYFLNPVVLRTKLSGETSFSDLLSQVRQTVIGGIANQDFPFPRLVQQLQPPRDPSRSPVFQVAFGWDTPRRLAGDAAVTQAADGLQLEPFALGQQGAAFDLMLMMLNAGGSLSAALQYNSDLFLEVTIRRWVEHFRILLEGIVADPSRRIAALPLLTDGQQSDVLDRWTVAGVDYPRDACLHELFEKQAEQSPTAVAVISGDQHITYDQLNRRGNQLARYLHQRGVTTETPVAIYLDRTIDTMVALLGVLKAGAAYVPLSPAIPAQRLAYILEETAAPLVLTRSTMAADLPVEAGRIVKLDEDAPAIAEQETANLPSQAAAENLAYVIFTSGSTGKPKGVQIEHRAVVNFLTSMAREPSIRSTDVMLAVTTLTFDISVLELFLPLAVGARIVLVPQDVAADGLQLAELLNDSGATIMQATPATWRLLVEAGWHGDNNLKILCGGEAMPQDLAGELLSRCVSLWNMYGPTETTIWSAVHHVREATGPIPIGRPIANTGLYILDSNMNPAPVGVAGDLYIGGDGLARGYHNRPELTAERFVTGRVGSGQPRRLYKTGDLARFHSAGHIEFLGRQDFQVKIRGYRIELAEIESVLASHPGVRQCVVAVRQTGPRIDDKQLIAYFVSAAADTPPNTTELREHLRGELPDYMVPSMFITMEQLPLNPAGKIDHCALPDPAPTRPELSTEYVAPRTPAEEALADIWMSVLGLEQVGVHDNLFDLGGASIQSLEIASLAQGEGLEVTPAMLFQYPTIAELAAVAQSSVAVDTVAPEAGQNGQPVVVAVAPPTAAQRDGRPATDEQRSVARRRKTAKHNTVIESLGIYLPPNEVTTKELMKGCQHKLWFPLEKMTGIHSRRMAGETEFSIDLARKAVEQCLAYSKYGADDVELAICCNIVRVDKLDHVSVEPNTSMQLKEQLGLRNAVVFDVTNACAGMFTAIQIIDAYLATGLIRRGMVVSGEFVTDISRTAQKEINQFMDPRLACLTVGDAGAAILLEAAETGDVGFHELDLYSLSKYSRMCIGRLTEQPHGGPIMYVPDPMEHTSVAVKYSVQNARYVLEHSPWSPEKMQHLIMHQTSDRSLRDGKRAINKAFGKKICTDKNTINNLAQRGNTATTSHFVAVWDNILNGRIESGDNVVFGITGSGQTIGTGIYTFDDLPDRLRRHQQAGEQPDKTPVITASPKSPPPVAGRVRVHSVGTIPLDRPGPRDTPKMTALAAEACLADSDYDRSDIELLVFAGMMRSGYISEPAIATLIAAELDMNGTIDSETDKKTLCFDVYNGSLGFLNACQAAAQMILAGTYETAMIVASEFEVNAEFFPDDPLGLQETASAVILKRDPRDESGFGQFHFKYFPKYRDARSNIGWYREGKPFCELKVDPRLEDFYLGCIKETVREMLELESLEMDQIQAVLPPQFSSAFNARLAARLGVEERKMVDVETGGNDLFTSALPYSIQRVQRRGLVRPGDVGLIINVASGIQVGCATYRF